MSEKKLSKQNNDQCSLMKFDRYLLHNSTGTFFVWVKAPRTSTDFSTELT